MKNVIRDEEGKPFSKWKPTKKFAYTWKENGLPGGEYVTEFAFDPVRKWRLDYAWPAQKLAVEIDGLLGRHNTTQGREGDNEKRNAAIEAGWRVLVFDSALLNSLQKVHDAVDQVNRILCGVER